MEEIRNSLLDRMTVVEEEFNHYLNNPYNPDRAHQLRVSLRTLRGLLNFFKKEIGLDLYDTLNNTLKETAQLYGRLREIDVLTEYCNKVALAEPNLSASYYKLFRHLHNDRHKEMHNTLKESRINKVRHGLSQTRERINRLTIQLDKDLNVYIDEKLKKRIKKLKNDYKNINYENYTHTHETRIKAKKIRYAAAYLADMAGKSTAKYEEKAKAIQSELGVIVDAHVNQHMLEEYTQEIEDKELRKILKDINSVIKIDE